MINFVYQQLGSLLSVVQSAFGNLKRQVRSLVPSRRPPATSEGAPSIQPQLACAQRRMATVHSNEKDNNGHQSNGMMIDDEEEKVDDAIQDEPTITGVNYAETGMQSTDNSSLDFLLDDLNSSEASNEQEHTGSFNTSSTTSTPVLRRSPRVSAVKVNYSQTRKYSVAGKQQTTLQKGTRKRRQSTGGPTKSTASKRPRVCPTPPEDEEGTGPLKVIVHRLKCHVESCKKEFPGKVQLDGHHLAKHNIEKYACKVKDCTESSSTVGQLTAHRERAHGKLGKIWPCDKCKTICSNWKSLREHSDLYHQSGLFACSECAFTETTRAKVKNHQRKHRQAGGRTRT